MGARGRCARGGTGDSGAGDSGAGDSGAGDSGAGDCGAGTLWVVVAIGVVAIVATWCVIVVGVGTVRTRAGAAADLSALAGAARLADAGADPCAQARRVAVANGAELRACVIASDRSSVEIELEVRGRGVLAHAPPARSRARAGRAP